MLIAEITQTLEKLFPLYNQESYDNCGLILGNENSECIGVLCTLDVTEAVILEAIENNCNLIIAHHPIIFSGLKKITSNNYVERTILFAIKNNISIYAIHTNIDNVIDGVNGEIANKLGLLNQQVLLPKPNILSKLFVFVPIAYVEIIKQALFNAGAGSIGNYSECSFQIEGIGNFKANEKANPFIGEINNRHTENEVKLEVIFPNYLQSSIVKALIDAHPYEEVAYDLIPLSNQHKQIGSGLIGTLDDNIEEQVFLEILKKTFDLKFIKHTQLLNKPINKVAVCGGAGSFLIKNAIRSRADIFITSDIKYHEFFDADNQIVIADIGHWESEQYTPNLILSILRFNFPTFALLKSKINTNPVKYFTH